MSDFPPRPAIALVQATVEPAHDTEFNEWYDERHLPQTVGCPGFRAGARYRSSDDKPTTYVALYVIEDERTMETPELAEIRGFEHLTPFVTYERRIYRPISGYRRGGTLERY